LTPTSIRAFNQIVVPRFLLSSPAGRYMTLETSLRSNDPFVKLLAAAAYKTGQTG